MNFSDPKTPEETALEQQLRALQPSALSEDALARLEKGFLDSSGEMNPESAGNPEVQPISLVQTPAWRAIFWSVAAIIMIGLWLLTVSLPVPTTEHPSQVQLEDRHQTPDPDAPLEIPGSVNEFSPMDETVTRNLRLTSVRDDGVVMSIGNTPMKRLRYEFIDTYQWPLADGGGRMRMEVPREDFVLVPVSTY